MLAARGHLVWLWFSQTARSLADACLAVFIVLHFSQFGLETGEGAWLESLAFLLMPFLLLAPLNGALSNSFPKQAVLVGSAAFCVCRTVAFAVLAAGDCPLWLGYLGLGVIGTGHVVYNSARSALLPVAAQETHSPLSRVVGWMEMGSVSGCIVGVLLGYFLYGLSWTLQPWHFASAVAASLGFDLLALVAALGAHVSFDVRRPEPIEKALASFFHDSKVLLKDVSARGSLIGFSCFMAVIAGGFLASLTPGIGVDGIPTGSASEAGVVYALFLAGLGAAGGCFLAGLQAQTHRVLGLVPPAAFALVAALVWAALVSPCAWVHLLLGLTGGLVYVPFCTVYASVLPAETRGSGMALMNAANGLSLGIAASWVFGLARLGLRTPRGQLWFFVVLAAFGALIAWRILLRQTFELLGEMVIWPMYRVHVRGPGIQQIPSRGPLLVIANHAAWCDPLWLAKIFPRRVTPMMTSRFFDLPVLHWLMTRVVGAIRVEEAAYRREAPELHEAVAVLDRGGCLLVFPEGALKRRPEQSLRRFGQGVWRILRQRPRTPVVACWIEGGWGSFTSYEGGPPTVHKHLDWGRPIAIGIEPPQVLDPTILADRHATRDYLMRACLAARRYLGLEPLLLSSPAIAQPESNRHYERA